MASSDSKTTVSNSAQSALNSKSLESLVKSHSELVNILSEKSDDASSSDLETRSRLRNIDVQLARIHEELNAGRQDTLAEIRSDISSLSSAIIQLVESNRTKN